MKRLSEILGGFFIFLSLIGSAHAQYTPWVQSGQVTMATSSASGTVALGSVDVECVVYNTGSNDAYVVAGNAQIVATTASIYVPASRVVAFSCSNKSYLAAISPGGTSTLTIATGSGVPVISDLGGGGVGTITLTGDTTGTGSGTIATTTSMIGGVSISLGGAFTTSGANTLTLTTTGNTTLTLPTTGTLQTTAGASGIVNTGTPGKVAVYTGTTTLGSTVAVSVPQGGTGVSTLTANGVVIGGGTGAVTAATPGTAGNVLTSTGASTPPTFQTPSGAELVGTTTNDNAAAGNVGQFLSVSVGSGSPIAMTTAMPIDIGTLSLTAGDWDVSGVVCFAPGTGTTITTFLGWISSTSATLPGSPNSGAYYSLRGFTLTGAAGQNICNALGTIRFSLATTTSVFISSQASFSVSTLGTYGFMSARRVR